MKIISDNITMLYEQKVQVEMSLGELALIISYLQASDSSRDKELLKKYGYSEAEPNGNQMYGAIHELFIKKGVKTS